MKSFVNLAARIRAAWSTFRDWRPAPPAVVARDVSAVLEKLDPYRASLQVMEARLKSYPSIYPLEIFEDQLLPDFAQRRRAPLRDLQGPLAPNLPSLQLADHPEVGVMRNPCAPSWKWVTEIR